VVVDSDQTVTAEFKLLSVVSFSAATYSVSEAGPAATISVTRSGGTHAGVSVDVATGDGTARAGADYVTVAQTLTFAAGQTSLTFAVPVSNGTLADGNKTVTLALSNVQGLAVLGPRPTALLTIVDNDASGTIQFSTASYTIAERPDAPTTAMIRVTRTGGAASGVTVDFATTDGTARAGTDYTAVTQTLTFGASEMFKDVPITILPDSLVEGDETIRLTLAPPTGGARLGAIQTATLTILDAQIGVQFSAPVYRASEGAGSATITVVRTGPTTRTTTVVYSTADGTAVAGVDYAATAGVLTFTPGTRSRTFTVPLREDTVADGVKTVLLLLGATTDGELGPQHTGVLTIADNDAGGTLQFSAPTYSVSEGAGTATITVVRTGGSASAVTVDFATRNGTATAGSDYVVTAGTLTFGANQASRTFTVSILNDPVVKGLRTVGLTLSNPTGGAVLGARATAVLNIVEDDAGGVLRFSAAGYRVSEGGLATITILRTGGAASGVTVGFTTADGTAVAGIDYTTTAGTLTFGAGETTKAFTVSTSMLAGLGRDRSATLVLSNPGGGGVLGVPATAQLTIEDTTPSLEFSAATYSVGEARASVTVTVLRSGPTTTTVSVRYATADGTATAGQDYTAASGILTFAPGVTARTFTIALRPDSVVEGDETIVLTLSDPVGAVLGAQGGAQVVIVDDDGPGTLQFGAAAYRVTEGGTATMTVVRTGGIGGTVGVNYTATPGTALSGIDYLAISGVLTFGPGVTSRTFTVRALDNTVVDPDRTVVLTLDQPTGGATTGTPNVAVLTITDNDVGGVMQFSAGTYTVTEGGLATISVIRGAGVASDVSVQYATTAGGTAVAGVDFAPVSGTLTFAAGQTSRSFTVPTFGDASAQGDRTVALALTAPTGGAILGPGVTATLVVVDDEPRVRFNAALYRIGEGGLATVTVLRSGPVTGIVTVDYTVSYLTATATDLDGSVSGTLVFGPGVTSRTFTVATHPDTLAEGDEMVALTLGSPVGASLATPSTAVLTIVDNEVGGTIQWSAAAYSTNERSGGVLVTITRSGGTASGVTVNYDMSDGTATAGLDYVATSGTVVFEAGETAKTVWIPVLVDAMLETTETFVLTLSDPTGGAALATPSSALVFIVDD